MYIFPLPPRSVLPFLFVVQGVGINHGGLLIQDAQQYHEGSFKCVVESSLGDTFERSAQVKVIGEGRKNATIGVDLKKRKKIWNILMG